MFINWLKFARVQILPGVRVIIVNPETRGPLGDSHLGEVGECLQQMVLPFRRTRVAVM